MIWVFRFDTNPENRTFNTWTRMCGPFANLDMANDFIKRASTATQLLKIVID